MRNIKEIKITTITEITAGTLRDILADREDVRASSIAVLVW
jgi:hypothetical protein